MSSKDKQPNSFAGAHGSAAVPYVWEVLRLIPHPQDEKKHTRCSMLLAAETIEQVWEYLAADRADAATEIESIARLAPLVATLPPNVPDQRGGANE